MPSPSPGRPVAVVTVRHPVGSGWDVVAGGALGLEPVAEFDEDHWRTMYETNVLGVARMTRALLPKLPASGDGHVITIGSVAGFEPYAGGGGYNAAKAGAAALSDVLRIELNGQPIRVSEIDPGMVETDFSLVDVDRLVIRPRDQARVYLVHRDS